MKRKVREEALHCFSSNFFSVEIQLCKLGCQGSPAFEGESFLSRWLSVPSFAQEMKNLSVEEFDTSLSFVRLALELENHLV